MLRIRGHRFDTISRIGPVLTYMDHNRGMPAENERELTLEFLAGHMGARTLATTLTSVSASEPESESDYHGHYCYRPTGQTLDEAFWRYLVGDTEHARPAPAELGLYCCLWECLLVSRLGIGVDDAGRTLGSESEILCAAPLWNSTRVMCCTGRAFALTRGGYMDMAPPGTVAGDAVCLLHGPETPFILRSLSADDGGGGDMCRGSTSNLKREAARLVGEAYVHGIMDGEAMGFSMQPQMFDIL